MTEILVLDYSAHGSVREMAQLVARGVNQTGAVARLRSVPPVAPRTHLAEPPVPDDGAPYVELPISNSAPAWRLAHRRVSATWLHR
jgi:NAD(P)H dehydrogenase (quinone)